MNKNILILAFISTAFFLGCSADGIFDPGNPGSTKWSKDYKSSSSGGGGGGTGYCLYGGQCVDISLVPGMTEQNCNSVGTYYLTQSACDAANSGGGSGYAYCVDDSSAGCYYTDDPYYTTSASVCTGWDGVLSNSYPAGCTYIP